MNLADELRKLQELHQSGALSDEEFGKAKASILGNAPAASNRATDAAAKPPRESSEALPSASSPDSRARLVAASKNPVWVACGILFVGSFLGAFIYFNTGDVVTVRKVELPVDPAERLEREATEQLIRLRDHVQTEQFPAQAKVVELDNRYFGRHKFTSVNCTWEIVPNKDSAAYPFKGVIRAIYCRWATTSHGMKELAEADDQFFLANYGTISWYREVKEAEAARKWMRPRESMTVTYLFDKSTARWIFKSQETN